MGIIENWYALWHTRFNPAWFFHAFFFILSGLIDKWNNVCK